MGRIFVELVEAPTYSCRCCGTALALCSGLLSKQFHSKNGPAWLFSSCINIVPSPAEERLMTTGMHVVADIACARCLSVVGWKYEAAHEESQKYKEGKFILERVHVVEASGSGSGGSGSSMLVGQPASPPRFARASFSPPAHPLHPMGGHSSASESEHF